MKRLNGYRMRLVAVGIVAAIVVGSGHAKADFTFGEPENLGVPINSSAGECVDYITPDGLTMYLDSVNRSGGYGGWDLWVTTRETTDSAWSTPVNLGAPVNTSQHDSCAYLSTDGLELYFTGYNRPGGRGSFDTWVAIRATKDDPWGVPTNLGSVVNSSAVDDGPYVSSDGLELYFSSRRAGGHGSDDIWVSRRTSKSAAWEAPENLGSTVNTSASEAFPFLSPDGLLLFFSEEKDAPIRPGGFGNLDLWVTRRVSESEPWGTPVNLGPIVNSSSLDCFPRISPDGFMLYFCSERPGGFGGPYGDAYQAPIIPIVDLNGDKIVDAEDMCIMVDHWGEDYSFCDIGPMPWGDGVVDVEDLKVLAEHLFQEAYDPTLVAHWPFDETEGMVVGDAVGDNQAFAVGDPVWQPDGGQVGGALLFDGVDDFISAPAVFNPADGPFSVLVWVQGGAPGQGIISETNGPCWLSLDPSAGNLMTELTSSGRDASFLLAESAVTDGNWHRIGLVWDGSNRTLYIDGLKVAEDTQRELSSPGKGLYIGCGDPLQPETFFSGMIDDIRIYNRAVKP